jgi:hypothetical protein
MAQQHAAPERGFENLRCRTVRIGEIQRLAEPDQLIDLVSRAERCQADGRERVPGGGEVGRVAALPESLEVRSRRDQGGRISRPG